MVCKSDALWWHFNYLVVYISSMLFTIIHIFIHVNVPKEICQECRDRFGPTKGSAPSEG
jgi:hypothetical protein